MKYLLQRFDRPIVRRILPWFKFNVPSYLAAFWGILILCFAMRSLSFYNLCLTSILAAFSFEICPFFVFKIYTSVVPENRLTSCQYRIAFDFELCFFCFQYLASFFLNRAWLYVDLDCLLFKSSGPFVFFFVGPAFCVFLTAVNKRNCSPAGLSAPTLHACFYCFAIFLWRNLLSWRLTRLYFKSVSFCFCTAVRFIFRPLSIVSGQHFLLCLTSAKQ